MNFKISSTVVIGLVALGAQAHAVDVGTYHVRVNVTNQVGGKWNDLATALSGWTCSSSTSATFAERLRDNHGQEKIIPRKTDANWNFFTNASVDMRFERDMEAAEPQTGITVLESCSKTTYHTENRCTTVTDYDSDGNAAGSHQSCHDEQVADTKTAIMTWNCSMPVQTFEVGQSQHTECKPDQNTFASFDFESWILAALRDKKFTADMDMVDHQERYAQDFCAGDKSNRVIVRLTQGVAGNGLQHHYIFSFNVAGHNFIMDNSERGNGILNDDIAVCGAGGTIPITVTAIAKNAIFPNSHYTPDQPQQGSLDLARKAPGNQGTIYLKRHAFLGNWTVNPDNWVAASVRDASEAPPAPAAPLAAATAIQGLGAVTDGLQPGVGVIAANDTPGAKAVAPGARHNPPAHHAPGGGARAVN